MITQKQKHSFDSRWDSEIASIQFPWSERRILIAGSTGFIGTGLTDALHKLGAREVTLLSRRHSEPVYGYSRITVDLTDARATHSALENRQFDIVVNASGLIDQSTRESVYEKTYLSNIYSTLYLVQALRRSNVTRFVQIGSNAEYGNAPCPHGDSTQESPVTAYGVSKLAATKTVLAKCVSEAFPACVLRPFSVYGKLQSQQSFLNQ